MWIFDKMSGRGIFGLILSTLLLAAPALADDYHYNNILVGDRAAGMGGAFTAVSDNASGCYYNPAGIVYGVGSNLSASVNAFSVSNKTYKGALTDVSGNALDWEQTSTVLLPNFFGATYDSPYGTLGFSYAVPDSVQRKQKQTFTNIKSSIPGAQIDEYILNINDVDNTYVFGPSFGMKATDDLSFGVTLYGFYRDATVIRNQLLRVDNNGNDEFEWNNGYIYRTEYGVKPMLGAMWSPTEKLVLGLTVSKGILFDSSNEQQVTFRGLSGYTYSGLPDFSNPDSLVFLKVDDDTKRKFPLTSTLGLAYFASPELLLSLDVSYHDAPEDGMESVINAAAGIEYYLTDRYALRAGLFSDLANTPDVKSGVTNQDEHVDLFGGSISLARFTRSTSTTVGVTYSYGSGDSQIISGSSSVQDLESSNLLAFLSAAYNF